MKVLLLCAYVALFSLPIDLRPFRGRKKTGSPQSNSLEWEWNSFKQTRKNERKRRHYKKRKYKKRKVYQEKSYVLKGSKSKDIRSLNHKMIRRKHYSA